MSSFCIHFSYLTYCHHISYVPILLGTHLLPSFSCADSVSCIPVLSGTHPHFSSTTYILQSLDRSSHSCLDSSASTVSRHPSGFMSVCLVRLSCAHAPTLLYLFSLSSIRLDSSTRLLPQIIITTIIVIINNNNFIKCFQSKVFPVQLTKIRFAKFCRDRDLKCYLRLKMLQHILFKYCSTS